MHNYIIGMPKCGTTTIFSALSLDDRISLGGEKEHNFFSNDVFSFKSRSSRSQGDYLSKFDKRKVCVDVSVNYAISKLAPRNICEFNSSANVLLIYRCPYRYIRSQYRQLYFAGYEKHASLVRSVQAEVYGKPNRYCPYKELLGYEAIAAKWKSCFPDIRIVRYEDMFLSKNSAPNLIYDWLGLDAIEWSEVRHNSSDEKEMNRYGYLLKSIGGRRLKAIVPMSLKQSVKDLLKKNGKVTLDDDISCLPKDYKALLDSAKEYHDGL